MVKIQMQKTRFFVQAGHNDHTIAQELLQKGMCDGVILDPQSHKAHTATMGQELANQGGEVYVKPHFFTDTSAWSQMELEQELERQIKYGATSLILPWPMVSPEPQNISGLQHMKRHADRARGILNKKGYQGSLLASLCLGHNVVRSEELRNSVLNKVATQPVNGFYIVCEQPGQTPFLSDPDLLKGLARTVLALSANGFTTVLGFGGYYAVVAFPFGLSAFASGGFTNTRCFAPTASDGFRQAPKPRYLTPRLLGSIKFPGELDQIFGKKAYGKLDDGSPYTRALFGNVRPTEVAWQRKESFLHYLWTCWILAGSFALKNYEERQSIAMTLIRSAENNYRQVQNHARLSSESQPNHLTVWKRALQDMVAELKPKAEYLFE